MISALDRAVLLLRPLRDALLTALIGLLLVQAAVPAATAVKVG